MRTCIHKLYGRIYVHNFVDNKAKIRSNTCRITRIFNAVSGEICRKDERKDCEDRFWKGFVEYGLQGIYRRSGRHNGA